MKNSNTNIITIILAAGMCAALLGGCFSPWDGSDGKGTISIAFDNSNARTLVTAGERGGLEYTITLSSEGKDPITRELASGSTSVKVSVVQGIWNVEIRAMGAMPANFIDADGIFNPERNRMLRGLGEATVTVEAGATIPVPVKMITATEVSDFDHLDTAFLNVNTDGKPEIVLIADNIQMSRILSPDADWGKKYIILRAKKNVTITRSNGSSGDELFSISDGDGILELDGRGGKITLQGNSGGNFQPLISVTNDGGTLIMYDGVTLTENHLPNGENGGGVLIDSYSGKFIMNGGTIFNNTAGQNGGGVHVEKGYFTMNGGTISGNTANNYGGGVYVSQGGSFTKTGGTIYGKDGTANENTTVGSGGGDAVYVQVPPRIRYITVGSGVSYNDETGFSDGIN